MYHRSQLPHEMEHLLLIQCLCVFSTHKSFHPHIEQTPSSCIQSMEKCNGVQVPFPTVKIKSSDVSGGMNFFSHLNLLDVYKHTENMFSETAALNQVWFLFGHFCYTKLNADTSACATAAAQSRNLPLCSSLLCFLFLLFSQGFSQFFFSTSLNEADLGLLDVEHKPAEACSAVPCCSRVLQHSSLWAAADTAMWFPQPPSGTHEPRIENMP